MLILAPCSLFPRSPLPARTIASLGSQVVEMQRGQCGALYLATKLRRCASEVRTFKSTVYALPPIKLLPHQNHVLVVASSPCHGIDTFIHNVCRCSAHQIL
jgi:hypothetical protein